MISKYVYVKACKDACIMLTRTEKKVLDSVTINGWFDEDAYLEEMENATPKIYITKHQRQIMKVCPDKNDDPFMADEKNRIREHLVRKIRKPNTKGEGTI